MSNDDDTSRGMPPPPPPGGDRPAPQSPQAPQDWGGDVAPSGPRPAGVGSRVVAYIVDSILVGIVGGIIGLLVIGPFMDVGGAGTGMAPVNVGAVTAASIVAGLISAVLTLAYFGYMEGNNSGRTLGKMMLSLRAVRADGSALDLSDAVKRRLPFVGASLAGSLVPFVGGLISLGIYIALLITAVRDKPWNRGWHDHYAGTMVIKS
jgi:uncharacterized RDD family membrane protein YckC